MAGISGTISLAAFAAHDPPAVTTIRAVTISPEQYRNRGVTLTGRFGGRITSDNDPSMRFPLNRSRWDFILKSDDAAVWVSGFRPVGRDFDLDPLSPTDSRAGRWLEVTGTVRLAARARKPCPSRGRCTQIWIEATDMQLTPPPVVGTAIHLQRHPVVSPPKVVFHDPFAGETDVPPSTPVRLQFSRHMIAETFSARVRISYASPTSLSSSPIPTFTATYHEETRSLEVRFATPLERFQTVTLELLAGIASADGRLLPPWTLTFTTGSH